jgi:hypothetical protein
VSNLEESLSSFFLSNETSSNELHKDRKVLSKPGSLLAKEWRFSNAARVNTRKGNTGQFVVFGMKGVGKHHEAKLGVFVRLGSVEAVAVCHGDRIFEASLEAIKLMKICNGIDSTSTNRIVISGD